jgi:phosphoribosylformimino-5-aminoimidazole carboxamide ribotide isomerase
MEIIPAIDIIDGKCVRLTKGDYNQKKVYDQDPAAVARRFEDQGLKRLHVVDLDGARTGKIVNHATLRKIASETNLHIDFGGGIKSREDLELAFDCGARQVTAGSIAVKNPELYLEWLDIYGAEKIILGADVNQEKIAVSGWQESTQIDLFDFIQEKMKRTVKYVICTDIQKDGLLQGPSVELYKKILQHFPDIFLIASGGVSSIKDLDKLKMIGCRGAIVGKAIYEGKISLEELQKFSN